VVEQGPTTTTQTAA